MIFFINTQHRFDREYDWIINLINVMLETSLEQMFSGKKYPFISQYFTTTHNGQKRGFLWQFYLYKQSLRIALLLDELVQKIQKIHSKIWRCFIYWSTGNFSWIRSFDKENLKLHFNFGSWRIQLFPSKDLLTYALIL